MARVLGVSGEVCWDVGEVRELWEEVLGEVRKVVWGGGEVWGKVWESVWGEWESVFACGERNGGGLGKCGERNGGGVKK